MTLIGAERVAADATGRAAKASRDVNPACGGMTGRRAKKFVEELPEAGVVVEMMREQSDRLVGVRRSLASRLELADDAAQCLVLAGEAPFAPVDRIDMRIGDDEAIRRLPSPARAIRRRAAKSRVAEAREHRSLDAVPGRREDGLGARAEQLGKTSPALAELADHRVDRPLAAAFDGGLAGRCMVLVRVAVLQHGGEFRAADHLRQVSRS